MFEILRLTEKQGAHSKMDNLYYSKLGIQNYLKMPGITTAEAQNLFRWRVRMAPFGENYRGGQDHVICPLCHNHLDNEPMALQCNQLKKEMEIKFRFEDIFKDDISVEKAKSLFIINEKG